MELSARQISFSTGTYWAKRADMIYYKYVDFIVRSIGANANSMIDVGTGGCPYLEWFDWIPQRVSFDREFPYSSENVRGIKGDVLTHDFAETFDLLTCLQVVEHVPEPTAFVRRLLEFCKTAIISVPYMWPEGATEDHINDPVSEDDLIRWAGRKANYSVIVDEPFSPQSERRKGRRLITIFDADPKRKFGGPVKGARLIRDFDGTIVGRANEQKT